MKKQDALKLIRSDFKAFIAYMCPNYKFTPLHLFLIERIQKVLDGEVTRLCVSMPPRHGKSYLLSELLPAFAFVRNPMEQVIAVSYGASLANEFGGKVRESMTSEQYTKVFPWATIEGEGKSGAYFRLDPLSKLKEDFGDLLPEIPDFYEGFGRGTYRSMGVGGPITGKPCTLGLIDDPIKSRAEADSPTYIKALQQFFGPDFFSRLEPGARVIVVHTRWSNQDLIGYILKNLSGWEYIRLPARADSEDDPLGRPLDSPLFPEKFGEKELVEIEQTMGDRDWAALYQQDPMTGSGNLWKAHYAKFADPDSVKPYEIARYFISYDCASELHELADFTGITVWAKTYSGRVYYVEGINERMDFNALIRKVAELNSKYYNAIHLVEKASNGTALMQYCGPNLPNVRMVSMTAHKSKMARFAMAVPVMEAGNLYFFNNAPNIDVLLEQMSDFKAAEYDDLADSALNAILYSDIYEVKQPDFNEKPIIKTVTTSNVKKRFKYG